RQMESVLRITGIEGAGEKAKWDGETSLMTKAEMNARARGLAPRTAEVEAKPAKKAAAPKAEKAEAAPKAAAAKKAPAKKAAAKTAED
ncbi:MAG TPA: 50S ribosomal protein L21, partial [Brevundimonas sp.]|nr:50S ribosomal protein L21 [Brevundimonas sp.]